MQTQADMNIYFRYSHKWYYNTYPVLPLAYFHLTWHESCTKSEHKELPHLLMAFENFHCTVLSIAQREGS